MLVAAMNPCKCGRYYDLKSSCRCSTNEIYKYRSKISGPLLDRIDIHIELPSVKYKELSDTKEAEPSSAIKNRVEKAQAIQRERFSAKMLGGSATICGGKDEGIFYNAQMNTKLIKKHCILENEVKELLRLAMTELGLSARAYDKILKVSRTIADLAESENIKAEHLSEAIQYRSLDRDFFI
jgi:magnesium chelatase family protein